MLAFNYFLVIFPSPQTAVKHYINLSSDVIMYDSFLFAFRCIQIHHLT